MKRQKRWYGNGYETTSVLTPSESEKRTVASNYRNSKGVRQGKDEGESNKGMHSNEKHHQNTSAKNLQMSTLYD